VQRSRITFQFHPATSAESPAGSDACVSGPGASSSCICRCNPPCATPALASAVWPANLKANSGALHSCQ
jgi:hypothetical protein